MNSTQAAQDLEPIAIVGMSCRLPGAPDVAAYWRNLSEGVESISFLSEAQLRSAGVDAALLADPAYVRAGGLIEAIEDFDAAFFGYSPREACLMEPQHRLFLECAWEAMEAAGYGGPSQAVATGVFGGAAMNAYLLYNLATRPDVAPALFDFQIQIGNDKDYLTTRVSHKLNLKGPSLCVQTACSSSLVAVHLACQSLLDGECDMALAGGVAVSLPQQLGHLHLAGGIHSVDGHCRPFDAAASGTVFGSGCGMVLLKRLADALADGDAIHAVIRGSAINNDGNAKVGFTAPSVEGQAAVIAEALAVAGLNADDIGYVECHGTGTAVGDPIELRALTAAFRQGSARSGYCAVGSVKSNIGHLDVASGVAGLIKAALAIEHQQIPATLHYRVPNPEIAFAASPFFVNPSLADWGSGLRRAGVSSFGLGGTNAHVVLEQALALPPPDGSRPSQLLLLSARTPAALERMSQRLASHLQDHPEQPLADIAFTLQTGRAVFAHRRALVGSDHSALVAALRLPDRHAAEVSLDTRQVVFMFPGQGAQHVGMARELYAGEPRFQAQVDLCAGLLSAALGLDLRDVLYPAAGQEEAATAKLNQTWITQPALFVVEYSLARLWMAWGLQPQALIGHSIGEYVAACLAGVLTLEDALMLVAARGRLMQDQPAGAMLAVDLPEAELGKLAAQGLDLAAVNSPSRCVLSGPEQAVQAAEQRLTSEGHRCRRLHTSHAFHSAMMDPALEPFAALLSKLALRPPRIPLLSNLTGQWMTDEQATDPRYYARQLRHTVRFGAGLATACRERACILLELGPGRSLAAAASAQFAPPSPAVERATAPIVLNSLAHPQQPDTDTAVLTAAQGRLWCAGQKLDWAAVHAPYRRRRLALPTYPFERQRHWIEPGQRVQAEPATAAATARVQQPARPRASKLPIDRCFYRQQWRRSPELPAATGSDATRGPWLVFHDGSAWVDALVQRLEQVGHVVTTVACSKAGGAARGFGRQGRQLDPRQRDDYDRLVAALDERGQMPRNIVHAWCLEPGHTDASDPHSFAQAQDRGLHSLLFLAQALASHGVCSPLGITVLASGQNAISGDEDLCPEHAPLAAACTVLSQEFANLDCRCLDLSWPLPEGGAGQQLIDQLLNEIGADAPERVVAYRGPTRWVSEFEPMTLAPPVGTPKRLRERGVYWITGGLGAIGAELARYLAHSVHARLVLSGRSILPARGEWAGWLASHGADDACCQRIRKLQALDALGAEVLVVRADCADLGQMRAARAEAEARFGRIDGVIHGAGIVAEDAFLTVPECTAANCSQHFSPKVQGLLALHRLFEDRPPDFCLALSSISSVLGGLGYAAYAAANLALDAHVQQFARRAPGRWVSVDWDAWQPETPLEGPPGIGAIVSSLALSPEEGVEAFARILDDVDHPQIVVSATDLATRVEQWSQRRSRGAGAAVSPPGAAAVASTINDGFATETQATLARIWREVLGVEQIRLDDNFFDVGGDSLLLMDVIGRLKSGWGVALNPREIMFQTLGQIAALVEEKKKPPVPLAAAPALAPRKGGLLDGLRRKVLGVERVPD